MESEQQLAQELKSVPASKTGPEKVSTCFDCSICLEFARDPVVTLCGHLYCWPCIYKWLEFQKSSSLSSHECYQCPVCKAEISHESIVPVYSHGRRLSEDEEVDNKANSLTKVIPPRPNASARQAHTNSSTLLQPLPSPRPYRNLQSHLVSTYDEGVSPALSNLGSPSAISFCGNYGEMVYARVFGNSESLYVYPNSYHTEGSTNPRMRRQEIKAFKSLNRISFFLFCCILLCLLLF